MSQIELNELENEKTLDKIRYFKGSFQDLKDMMDKKAKQNTNAMDDVDYEYPNTRKAKGTSPVYQTFGIVNNPNKVYEMKNLKPFETFNEKEYYAMGFGAPSYGGAGGIPAGYGLGWPDYRSYTGYTMSPVMGVVSTLKETLEKEADAYEKNDNPEHTAKSYLKEASKCISEELKSCYEKYEINESQDPQKIAKDTWDKLHPDEKAGYLSILYDRDYSPSSKKFNELSLETQKRIIQDVKDGTFGDINENEELFELYDVAKKTEVIKNRNIRNQKGLEMAKLKNDKTGEKMYQMKLQLDQIDLQKTKLKGEISKIQDERKVQREKIQSIGK